ncbi:MAG: hypothetical protein B6V02_01755 [Thermoprotei archaeon ex4572_64]|nr:MAG: hypothetical protein B6V02_01755 [Thermoprotei archaeon ex4572_64]
MGRRRKSRKKVLLKPKKRIPKVFTCPNCGATVVNVNIDRRDERVKVTCGNCGLEAEMNLIPGYLPVDYFNKFIDMYYQGLIKPKREVIVSVSELKEEVIEEVEEAESVREFTENESIEEKEGEERY